MDPIKRKIPVGLYLFVVVLQVHSSQDLSLCTKCLPPPQNDSKVVSFCESNQAYKMYGRCCVSINQSIVYGLDLTGCGVKELHDKMFEEFWNMDILTLENNEFTNYEKIDFFGLKSLNYLTLPNINSSCPGDEETWDNITVYENYVECQDQSSSCMLYNLTCPGNSHCIAAGPGYAECICNADHYGYKCKRTGHFPIDIYSISTAGGIGLFSAVLWFLERRKIRC